MKLQQLGAHGVVASCVGSKLRNPPLLPSAPTTLACNNCWLLSWNTSFLFFFCSSLSPSPPSNTSTLSCPSLQTSTSKRCCKIVCKRFESLCQGEFRLKLCIRPRQPTFLKNCDAQAVAMRGLRSRWGGEGEGRTASSETQATMSGIGKHHGLTSPFRAHD